MKRVYSLLLVLVLIVSMGLTGCGNNNNAAQSSTGNASTSAGTAAVDENPDPFGKYASTVTVKYARNVNAAEKFKPGESYENNIWVKEYESELGIKTDIAWSAEGVETYETKLNLMIASNDLPDLFKVHNQGQLQRLVNGNMVEDLTSVYEKYASPFVKEVMAKDGGAALKQCTINGQLAAYPTTPLKEEQLQYFFVRDDLRKEIGKEEPKTFEDLIDLGKALVQSGKVTTAFGFGNNPYDGFMSMLGVFNAYGAFPGSWIEKDGKLVYGSTQPEMKTALTALSQMYKDGLLDKEFVVKDGMAASQDAVAGKTAIIGGQFWMNGWPLPDAWKADNKVDWRPYPILFSKDTANKVVIGKANAVVATSAPYCIRKGYKNPEVVAKLHNYFMEKSYGATSDEKKYRVDGEYNIFGYAVVGGGLAFNNLEIAQKVTEAIDTKDESKLTTNEEKAKYQSVKSFMDGTAKEQSNMAEYKYYYGPNSVFGIEKYYRDNNMLITDQFFGSETPEMLRRMSILNTNEKEMILKIVTGEKPVDEFDSFVKSWNDLGGATITIEVNEWKKTVGK